MDTKPRQKKMVAVVQPNECLNKSVLSANKSNKTQHSIQAWKFSVPRPFSILHDLQFLLFASLP